MARPKNGTKPASTETKATDVKASYDTVVAKDVKADAVERENADLKAQLDELKAQMALMAQMMSAKPETKRAKVDKQIRFVNMSRGTVVLRGTVMWKIKGQFAYKDFTETEANVIVANMSNIVRSGGVYIADKDFIDEHGLTEVYKYILSDEQLKTLFDKNSADIIEMYKMANDTQREIILEMIISKKERGEFVDANVAIELGKLCGKDLMGIEPEDE